MEFENEIMIKQMDKKRDKQTLCPPTLKECALQFLFLHFYVSSKIYDSFMSSYHKFGRKLNFDLHKRIQLQSARNLKHASLI
jgi:hypothetical protein